MVRVPRILAVNPNTSTGVTETFVREARRIAPDGLVIDGVTGRFGARIVSTEAENIIAAHSALDLVATHAADYDAVILAISFDTGLRGVAEMLSVPVIGITHAALDAARASARPVGVVLFGTVSQPLYARLIASYGVTPVAVEIVELGSAADYLSPEKKDAAVTDACHALARRGAEAVVICGTAIVGMAARLADQVPVALHDGSAALDACLAALDSNPPEHPRPAPLGGTVGLSSDLASLLASDGRWARR